MSFAHHAEVPPEHGSYPYPAGPSRKRKSAAACVEIFRLATKMPPCKDGIRHSRACFIRDSDANLRKTTVRTWLKWFPEDVSKNGLSGLTKVNWSSPMSMRLNFKLPDNTWVDCEICASIRLASRTPRT